MRESARRMRRLRRLRCQIAVLWKFFAVESTSNALNNIPQASELFYKIALPMEGHVIIDDLFILSDPFVFRSDPILDFPHHLSSYISSSGH